MSSPSFYKNVVPLNRDRHRKLKIVPDDRRRFAAEAHFVPVAAIEIYESARHYPVVFAGGKEASPLVMLGLRAGENLFVDAEGRWAEDAYVPAFVRRYPFILARPDQAGSDFTVCIDESYDGFSETEGTPLFDEEGKDAELVTQAVELLKDLLAETERTRRFVERLNELELLTVQSMEVQDGLGRRYALRDFRVVDEKKLAALESEALVELHRSGYLGCIYAHLFSLGNIARLAQRVPDEQSDAPAGSTDAAN